MIGNLLRVSPAQLEKLLADPDSIETFLYPQGEQLFEEGAHLDIDKSWHLIQFLLTGEPWGGAPPLANAICGGEEIGEVDVGYGPARFVLSAQVREIATALGGITADELWSRFDVDAVKRAEIYPADSWTDEDFGYVAEHYGNLRLFYRVAAERSEAVITFIN